jgi:hypothetical protein
VRQNETTTDAVLDHSPAESITVAVWSTGMPAEPHRTERPRVGDDDVPARGTLLPTGLVDAFRLFVYPAVQGHGRQLFGIRGAEWWEGEPSLSLRWLAWLPQSESHTLIVAAFHPTAELA